MKNGKGNKDRRQVNAGANREGELEMILSVQRKNTSEEMEKWEIRMSSYITCYRKMRVG